MNQYLTIAILFSLALLQSTVMPRITVLGVHPDLVLVAVTSWSLLRGSGEGLLWALVGGVVIDLFSGAPFGVHTLALLAVSFVSGLGQQTIFRSDWLTPIVVIPLATLIYQLMVLGLLTILGWRGGVASAVRYVVLPSMLANTLVMPIVYPLARLLHQRMGREEAAW